MATTAPAAASGKPALWTPGDWNAFFGFGTNILVNMLVLTGLLRFVLKMPDSLVFGRILPALGLMMCLSTLYYAFLAYRLALRTGRSVNGVDPDTVETSVNEVLVGKASIADAVVSCEEGIDLVPSVIELAGVEAQLLSRPGREYVLRTALESVATEAGQVGRRDRRRVEHRPQRRLGAAAGQGPRRDAQQQGGGEEATAGPVHPAGASGAFHGRRYPRTSRSRRAGEGGRETPGGPPAASLNSIRGGVIGP